MSNVIMLDAHRRKPDEPRPAVKPRSTSEDFASMVIDWAEAQGLDIANDMGFKIRLSDFMAHLQMKVKRATTA
jgi:hypothetical protein